MPITKSAKKALRQAKKRTLRNLAKKRELISLRRKFKKALESKNKEEAEKLLFLLYKKIDKMAKTNIFKKNTAARRKSYFARLFFKTFK